MGNRIIKDTIRTSKTVNFMTDFQFRVWVYLITYVDDYGRGSADPELIKGLVFPRRKRLTESDIEKALSELAGMGCISLYDVDGESYFYFPSWGKHQRIQTKKSKFPAPENGISRNSTVGHGEPPPEFNPNPIQSESESEGESRARGTRFIPPTLEEVAAYVRERGSKVDPQGFIDFYAANGWMIGKTPMKDWKAACRNAEKWERWDKPAQGGGHPQDFQPDTGRIQKNNDWLDGFLAEQEGKGGGEP